MAGMSDTTEAAVLALIFNATTWANYAINATSSPETTIELALSTGTLTDTSVGNTTETTYTSYARVSVARTSGGFTISATSPTQAALAAAATFPAGTGGSGTVTDFAATKAGGGASVNLMYGLVTPNIVTGNGVTPQLTTATKFTLD